MRRLMREVATLRTSPPDGLRIVTSDEDMLDIIGVIAGPGKPISTLPVKYLTYEQTSTQTRGHTIRGRIFPSQVPVHGGIPGCPTEV